MPHSLASFNGWQPNPAGVKAILADDDAAVWPISARSEERLNIAQTLERMGTDTPPVILFDALMPLQPSWARGSQGIGDCVSWGFELCAALNIAVDIMVRKAPWKWAGEVATEPIYAGSRVEARGVDRGGYSDGSYGGAAAQWLTQWGVLHRIDYSLATGNKEHDLRTYSADRAKSWGNYGCGGKDDQGKLDTVAKSYPVEAAHLVTKFAVAAAAIESGYAIPVCSNLGFGARSANGFAPRKGSWSHCMALTGVRYDKPGLLLTNSWGNSWGDEAPFYPTDYPYAEVIKCSAWITQAAVEAMLAQEDSYILTGVAGLERRAIDWATGWNIGGR
jgi:hypothetical protein